MVEARDFSYHRWMEEEVDEGLEPGGIHIVPVHILNRGFFQ